MVVGELYNRRKRKDGGHGDQKSEGKVCTPNMAEVVAEEIQVSPRTVKNAGEFAQVLEVIREKAGPAIRRQKARRRVFFVVVGDLLRPPSSSLLM